MSFKHRYIEAVLKFLGGHPSMVPYPQLGACLVWLLLKLVSMGKQCT